MEQRRQIEIIIAVVFVAFLIAISVWVVSAYGGSGTRTTITNSYNTYNYNNASSNSNSNAPTPIAYLGYNNHPNYYPGNIILTSAPAGTKPYIIDYGNYAAVYYVNKNIRYSNIGNYNANHLRYSNQGYVKTETTILGTPMTEYGVNVRNQEYVGGYFKVMFYFDDYYGNEISFPTTKYIPARQSATFTFKDMSDKYKYTNWHYAVTSMDTVPN